MERDILDEQLTIHKPKKSYTFHLYPTILWGIIYLIGELFKLMHWPFASIMLVTSLAGLLAYLLNTYITLKGKSIINQTLFFLTIFRVMNLMLTKDLTLGDEKVVFFPISLVFFIISFIFKKIRLKKISHYNATLT